MRIALQILSILLATSLGAQTIRVTFEVTPAVGPTISLDGDEKGAAHKKKFVLGFNERKGINDHEVVIKLNGYEDQVYRFDRESEKNQTIHCTLERKLPKFDPKPEFYIDIEKVVSGMEYSTDVGANTRWKYRYNEAIDMSTKQRKLTEALDKMGLRTVSGNTEDLFDVGNNKVETPDILIAGRVESFRLERLSGSSYGRYRSNMTINWQLFDRHKKEIILKSNISTSYTFSSNLITEEFYNAVVENFYALANDDKQFYSILSSYHLAKITRTVDSTATDDEAFKEDVAVDLISIPLVRLPETDDFSDLVEVAMSASVTVIVDEKGHGSGVVVSPNGYIVTNHHVTNDARLIDVQFSNGITLPADIITYSEKHDLALIKVRASGLTALPINANAEDVREGSEVFVVGAPADRELGQSVSKGIISARRTLDGVKIIQTDTKISPGNSGSPLINSNGEVIGIINMKMIGVGVEGLSFAIDARYLFNVLGLSYE